MGEAPKMDSGWLLIQEVGPSLCQAWASTWEGRWALSAAGDQVPLGKWNILALVVMVVQV